MMRAEAFAPASVANVAVGFDLLGFSIGVAGDKVRVEKTPSPGVVIEGISGVVTKIPLDPRKNTATAGLVRLQEDLGLKFGFKVFIEKGIPLGSGMGGSAASAVAAIVAANALLEEPLCLEKLASYALLGEAQASGAYHADNVAPCLFGGLTLARVRTSPETGRLPEVEVTPLPLPPNLYGVVVHPELTVETKQARGLLKSEISLRQHIEQSANLAGFIAGCFNNDFDLLRRSLKDLIVERQRAHLIPGFYQVQEAALGAGALGCSISGAGPSVFAWAQGKEAAEGICGGMVEAFHKAGVRAEGWAALLGRDGARVIA